MCKLCTLGRHLYNSQQFVGQTYPSQQDIICHINTDCICFIQVLTLFPSQNKKNVKKKDKRVKVSFELRVGKRF